MSCSGLNNNMRNEPGPAPAPAPAPGPGPKTDNLGEQRHQLSIRKGCVYAELCADRLIMSMAIRCTVLFLSPPLSPSLSLSVFIPFCSCCCCLYVAVVICSHKVKLLLLLLLLYCCGLAPPLPHSHRLAWARQR